MRFNNLQTKKNYMNLSNELDNERIPEHVAIIMDGNGRWAKKRAYLDHLGIIRVLVF